MKKTLIALAAVAVSSAAMAQVTVSGSINARYENSNATGNAADKINGFNFSDSEVVFSFSEDLGSGMKASGSMSVEGLSEGAGGTGSGTILGLSGGFGSVVFSNKDGSDYLPIVEITGSGFSASSANDRVTYTSPSISGARLSVTYSDGNGRPSGSTLGSDKAGGTSTVYSLDYATGPLTLNVGLLKPDSDTKNDASRFKASYNFGVAAVTYGQVNTKDVKPTSVKRKETALSISAPLGSAVKVGYSMATSKTGNAKALDGSAISLSYALSKRTSISFEMLDYEKSGQPKDAERNRVNLSHSF